MITLTVVTISGGYCVKNNFLFYGPVTRIFWVPKIFCEISGNTGLQTNWVFFNSLLFPKLKFKNSIFQKIYICLLLKDVYYLTFPKLKFKNTSKRKFLKYVLKVNLHLNH